MKKQITLNEGAGIVFDSIPDNGEIKVCIGKNGQPDYIWPNKIVLPNHLLNNLRRKSFCLFHPWQNDIEYIGVNWIINLCADPDEYQNALINLDEALGETTPVFNHPRAIALSRRDIVAKLMKGVPNLTVPMCLRFTANRKGSFEATFEEGGFKYPVLVRPTTSQSGHGLLKIDEPSDWQKIYLTHWYKRSFYMSEFIDYRSANGNYHKVRVSFIGGKPRIRGWQESRDWLLTGSQTELLSDRPDYLINTIRSLASNEKFLKMREELARRLPLDFFGVDIGVKEDEFILFEATAAMSMARQTEDDGATSPIMQEVYAKIEEDLNQILFDPRTWSDKVKALPAVSKILNL